MDGNRTHPTASYTPPHMESKSVLVHTQGQTYSPYGYAGINGGGSKPLISRIFKPHPTVCTYLSAELFFSGGKRTPKHFVNLTGESKNFTMLEFPLNQLQTYYGYLCYLLSFM
jgi:hypothetical protein